MAEGKVKTMQDGLLWGALGAAIVGGGAMVATRPAATTTPAPAQVETIPQSSTVIAETMGGDEKGSGSRDQGAGTAASGARSLIPSSDCPCVRLEGDANGDWKVDFDDYTAVGANYGRSMTPPADGEWSPGELPGEHPGGEVDELAQWAAGAVVAAHPMAIEDLESPEYTLLIVRGEVGAVVADLGLSARFVRGLRGVTWPGGWPAWPPPGSDLELLMERWTTDDASVEAAARRVLEEMGEGGGGGARQ